MSTQSLAVPPTGYEFGAARQRYIEQYGSTHVMNTYLKVAVFCLSLVAVVIVSAWRVFVVGS